MFFLHNARKHQNHAHESYNSRSRMILNKIVTYSSYSCICIAVANQRKEFNSSPVPLTCNVSKCKRMDAVVIDTLTLILANIVILQNLCYTHHTPWKHQDFRCVELNTLN